MGLKCDVMGSADKDAQRLGSGEAPPSGDVPCNLLLDDLLEGLAK